MICVIGIAGSGKNTQADLLASALNCPTVDSGTILRQHATGEARRQLNAGELVDDAVTLDLLDKELIKIDAKHKECIWVGSPRSVRQAEWLAEQVQSGNLKYTATIHLRLEEKTARRRLIKRGRQDDQSQAALNQRFAEYDNRMGEVITYLKEHRLTVTDIDASGSVEAVHKAVMESLNEA